jgi:tRNA uridine 5-carboxymethylaminomethyl modification enzyme
VREIDALGGEMGRAADRACIQYRLLGRSKGPAVHSLRAQADRRLYQATMRNAVESQPGLSLFQAEVVAIRRGGVIPPEPLPIPPEFLIETHVGVAFPARAVVIAAGTYLQSRVTTGDHARPGGPDGLQAANSLSDCLRGLGLRLQRFKTGTPPRIDARTVDFSKMEAQHGDPDYPPFSFTTREKAPNRVACYLTYTNEATHRVIRENLHRSPLYAEQKRIDGTGTRYCPSVEDKIVRFAGKPRHPVFIEPMGLDTHELYAQGLSSSLPVDVQAAVMHTIPGLENAAMTRPGYAIEYDCADPLELNPALMCKRIPGLFAAGQVVGTSGYEEAAALGLLAGINAALRLRGEEPLVLRRDESYIGTLIDDLVTKGTNEPYRMMTSRAEYRLLLRQDNADERLTRHGHRIGLISDPRMRETLSKYAAVDYEIARLSKVHSHEHGAKLSELLKRPETTYAGLSPHDPERPGLSPDIIEQVELRFKYGGYIDRQHTEVKRLRHMEERKLPPDWDYAAIPGLRVEAAEKLARVTPSTLGQAARISGVNPSDITVLMLALERGKP